MFLSYLSLKILQSDWARAFSHLIWESDFSQSYSFNRIIKVIMVHDLNPKNLHINVQIFFYKIPKTYFQGIFGHYPQKIEIFSPKSSSISFSPIRHPNFMTSFRKILWAILEKTCLPIDIMTYWHGEILGAIFS